MAEKSTPGMEFSNYWTRFVPSTPAGDPKKDILGKMLAGLLGGLDPSSEEEPATSDNKQPISPSVGQYMPPTQFPEVFNQQYSSPYAPAYTPEPVAPPSGPSSLQGFVKPPQYGVQPQPPANLSGFQIPKLGATGQPQNQYNDLTHSIWSKNNG